MSRKITETYSDVKVSLSPSRFSMRSTWDRARANESAEEFITLVKRHVLPHFGDATDIDVIFEDTAVCGYCNSVWTEESSTYNGGCCGQDEANNPERMAAFAKLAEDVRAGDFYDYDTGIRGRVRIDWPNALADAVADWIAKGRPTDAPAITALRALADRVHGREWCTVWEDPGPDGCSLARLPDQVSRDAGPNDLSDELMGMLDDMGALEAYA